MSLPLFGKNRLMQVLDAWIQAGRFDGADRSLIKDHTELTGMLTQAIEAVLAFCRRSLVKNEFGHR
jgi:predicted HTH transcriptional regulator